MCQRLISLFRISVPTFKDNVPLDIFFILIYHFTIIFKGVFMGYKNSNLLSAINLLRLALGLVIIGFFLPIGCKSNGVEIANGILENGSKKIQFGLIEDVYDYLLFGVLVLVVAALVITFLSKIEGNFIIASILMAVSLALVIFILFKFNFSFSFKDFAFKNKYWPGKINFLPGFYLMFAGYALGIVTFILKSAVKKLD